MSASNTSPGVGACGAAAAVAGGGRRLRTTVEQQLHDLCMTHHRGEMQGGATGNVATSGGAGLFRPVGAQDGVEPKRAPGAVVADDDGDFDEPYLDECIIRAVAGGKRGSFSSERSVMTDESEGSGPKRARRVWSSVFRMRADSSH